MIRILILLSITCNFLEFYQSTSEANGFVLNEILTSENKTSKVQERETEQSKYNRGSIPRIKLHLIINYDYAPSPKKAPYNLPRPISLKRDIQQAVRSVFIMCGFRVVDSSEDSDGLCLIRMNIVPLWKKYTKGYIDPYSGYPRTVKETTYSIPSGAKVNGIIEIRLKKRHSTKFAGSVSPSSDLMVPTDANKKTYIYEEGIIRAFSAADVFGKLINQIMSIWGEKPILKASAHWKNGIYKYSIRADNEKSSWKDEPPQFLFMRNEICYRIVRAIADLYMEKNNDPEVIIALADMQDERTCGILINSLNQRNLNENARIKLVSSLSAITKQNFGDNVSKWQEWWNSYKGKLKNNQINNTLRKGRRGAIRRRAVPARR